jgi:hypothetical protein
MTELSLSGENASRPGRIAFVTWRAYQLTTLSRRKLSSLPRLGRSGSHIFFRQMQRSPLPLPSTRLTRRADFRASSGSSVGPPRGTLACKKWAGMRVPRACRWAHDRAESRQKIGWLRHERCPGDHACTALRRRERRRVNRTPASPKSASNSDMFDVESRLSSSRALCGATLLTTRRLAVPRGLSRWGIGIA